MFLDPDAIPDATSAVTVPLPADQLIGHEFVIIGDPTEVRARRVLRVVGVSELDAERSRIHGRAYESSRLGAVDLGVGDPGAVDPGAVDPVRTGSIRIDAPDDATLLIRNDGERARLCVDFTQWQWRYTLPGRTPLTEPLEFVRDALDELEPGQRVLMLGDGEGRNAVWAARQHQVDLVELSSAGCSLAESAASAAGVEIEAHCADLVRWLEGIDQQWDAVCMTYVALAPRLESFVGQRIRHILAPGGVFIGEFAERVIQPGGIDRIAPFEHVRITRSDRGDLTRVHVVARAAQSTR